MVVADEPEEPSTQVVVRSARTIPVVPSFRNSMSAGSRGRAMNRRKIDRISL